ncbi:hypothetical protein C2S51_000155 [Perilla frutescens var. frutescens]|nr:hypothetical protein C2S51_000155 [Perilla frutescens var. frutescens]
MASSSLWGWPSGGVVFLEVKCLKFDPPSIPLDAITQGRSLPSAHHGSGYGLPSTSRLLYRGGIYPVRTTVAATGYPRHSKKDDIDNLRMQLVIHPFPRTYLEEEKTLALTPCVGNTGGGTRAANGWGQATRDHLWLSPSRFASSCSCSFRLICPSIVASDGLDAYSADQLKLVLNYFQNVCGAENPSASILDDKEISLSHYLVHRFYFSDFCSCLCEAKEGDFDLSASRMEEDAHRLYLYMDQRVDWPQHQEDQETCFPTQDFYLKQIAELVMQSYTETTDDENGGGRWNENLTVIDNKKIDYNDALLEGVGLHHT